MLEVKSDEVFLEKMNYINRKLYDERFYLVLKRVDDQKFSASVESANLDSIVLNGLSGFLYVKEKLEKDNLDNEFLNIFSAFVSSNYIKKEIVNFFDIYGNENIKLNINHKNNAFDEILKYYTSYLSDEVLLYKQERKINNISDIANFTYSYFDAVESDVKRKKDDFTNKKVKIKFKETIFETFNVQKVEEKNIVTFDDVGGLKKAKQELYYLSKGLREPRIYEEEGIRPPKGLILAGPPGTGKTLLARALAYESGLPYTYIQIKDVVSKWYGESSKLLAKMLAGEGIKFLDEFDALARSRNKLSCEATDMIVDTLNQILNEENSRIFYIAATNRIDDIDEAVKRAGRFDKIITCFKPNREEVKEIFDIHKNRAEKIAKKKLFEKLDYEEVTKSMEAKGMVGADINEIIRRCLEQRVKAKIDGKKPILVKNKKILEEIESYERDNSYLK